MRPSSELRQEALEIFRAGVAAVDPYQAVRSFLTLEGETLVLRGNGEGAPWRRDLRSVRHLRVLGAGKASAGMAQALEDLLGDRIDAGLVTVKTGHSLPTRHITLVEAGHPVPDQEGLGATERQLELVQDLSRDDLVLAVISGGGSALMPLPAEGISLGEKQALTSALLAAGASIHEVNCVRKHISAIKGGQLARRVFPATLVTLVLSDVVGDDLDVIASGPTVPDASHFREARRVLERFSLWKGVADSIRSRFEAGERGEIPENPGPGDEVFEGSVVRLVASSGQALEACERVAKERGWSTLVLSSRIQGEAREVARVLASVIQEIRHLGRPVVPPACVLVGGETTVTLRGSGKGGRNQELALAACLALEGEAGVLLFSGGTDGSDGPTDAAGGMALGDSVSRARSLGIDLGAALRNNDAYPALDQIGDLIRTGPTGTNVMDLQVLLVDA